ncbi:hypothetical protein R1sor_002569 [Riccia sorocarpa]|uniref:Protein EARLY FLOWERING 4 domain-containing protein n=1 Tax=Riccia sorocarpa TaxID=122646 RepID=A0ABD3H2A7_9MARC
MEMEMVVGIELTGVQRAEREFHRELVFEKEFIAMEGDASSSPPAQAGPQMDPKIWAGFHQNFSQVQFLLDHNRLLINEINQNHESKIPESLTRNVLLIRELNNNITKVVDLYASLSVSFVKLFDNNTSEDETTRVSSKPAENIGTMKPPPSSQAPKSARPSVD